MSFKKYLPIALIIACIAATLQAVDQYLGQTVWSQFAGFGWISFLSWAVYFMGGCTVKDGVRACMGFFLGVIASIAIFKVGGLLGGLGFWAMPACLVILVTCIMQLENAPSLFNFVPSLFVGAGTYFAMCSYVITDGSWNGYLQAGIIEMVYCVFGLLCGFLTVAFRNWYEPKYVNTEVKK